MTRLTRVLVLLGIAGMTGCLSSRTLTIVHFSDYHSHAVPFYAAGESDSGGIARAIGFLRPLASREDVLIFNGGDTMNLGAPPWSDKYRCIEWSWWNGIVDAMAFGNHDADYGSGAFADCRNGIDYPILSANAVGPEGEPLFAPGGRRYALFERGGIRVGVFALSGSDFPVLIQEATAPVPGVRFLDREATAREVVTTLRDQEGADVIVLIGHASFEEDVALVRRVPGIDLVLGTHSHRLQPLTAIEGTTARIISPGQYLTHLARVTLHFEGRQLTRVDGALVPMRATLPEDPAVAARVRSLQQELENDPVFAPLFRVVATLDEPLSNDDVNLRTTRLGSLVMERVRDAVDADVAISTSSSFRGSLPAGPIRETHLREVLPYDNRVVTVTMTGGDLSQLLERVDSLRGTDSFAQIAGATIERTPSGEATIFRVGGAPVDPGRQYTVATTDYLARVAPSYRDIFEPLTHELTPFQVRDLLRTGLADLRPSAH